MPATTNEHPSPKEDAAPDVALRIQTLVEQIESVPDPASRALMQDCIAALLELYGDGLTRIMALFNAAAPSACEALAGDEVIRALLLVHGLHPVPVERRLAEALDTVRPYMESHGGNIEAVSVENGVATLRLEGHCKTCPSSTITMELAVRAAIEEACPDLEGIELADKGKPSGSEFHIPAGAPAWHALREEDLDDGTPRSIQVNGARVLLCSHGAQRYAYRDHCPACDGPLRGGTLENFELRCPAGHRFDIRRAGISPDEPTLHLDPFPLVTSGDVVKVAVR